MVQADRSTVRLRSRFRAGLPKALYVMKKAIFTLSVLVALGGGFYAGTRIGVVAFGLADSQYKATVTAGYLRLIRNGELSTLQDILESKLDTEIAVHGQYLKSNLQWLWPQLQPTKPWPIKYAIEYRLAHPFDRNILDSLPSNVQTDDSFVRYLVDGQEEIRRQVEEVIRHYSDDGV